MNVKSKKGYALGMAISFVILALITSVAIYANTFYISSEARRETENIRGYYIDMAGLRYASILLQNPTGGDPASGTGFKFPDTTMQGRSVTLTFSASDGKTFSTDIGLTGNDVLKITATEYDPAHPPSDPNWTSDKYQASAAFTS